MFKHYFEGTGSSDIAQSVEVLSLHRKHRKKLEDEDDIIDEMKGGLRSDLESALQTIAQNCKSKRMHEAIDEVLDLMDTDC